MIYKKDFPYAFDENACAKCGGKCCTGESGNIFINNEEINLLSDYLKLDKKQFMEQFIKKVGLRYSLKEVEFEQGYACVFFDQIKRNCSIYELRPKQCKTFPFWKYFKYHKEELQKECIGIYYLS